MMTQTANQDTGTVVSFWKIAPGEHAWMWDESLALGTISINWLNARNFEDFETKEEIRRALAKQKDGHGGAPSILSFVKTIQRGHVVVANNGLSRIEGVGFVTSGYLHPDHPKNPRKKKRNHRHVRRVQWLLKEPVDLPRKLFIQPTVEPLDSEQCHVIKQTYLKEYPKYKKVLDELFPPSDDSQFEQAEDVREIRNDPTIGPTTKKALIDARRGQGAFRESVLRHWGYRCAVTGAATARAIRASHIQSWKESTNKERLDPDNGLPLVASLDALFDAGLISFDSSGVMLVSPRMSIDEQKIFGLQGSALKSPPTAKMAKYLAFHRHKHDFAE
jgi:hypothetical protein